MLDRRPSGKKQDRWAGGYVEFRRVEIRKMRGRGITREAHGFVSRVWRTVHRFPYMSTENACHQLGFCNPTKVTCLARFRLSRRGESIVCCWDTSASSHREASFVSSSPAGRQPVACLVVSFRGWCTSTSWASPVSAWGLARHGWLRQRHSSGSFVSGPSTRGT